LPIRNSIVTLESRDRRLDLSSMQARGAWLFEKVVSDLRHVSHVIRVREARELGEMKQFLREAYRSSLSA